MSFQTPLPFQVRETSFPTWEMMWKPWTREDATLSAFSRSHAASDCSSNTAVQRSGYALLKATTQ